MSFRWIPRTAPDKEALERLKQHFPKPNDPPPVAWFMSGEINYHNSIIEIEPNDISLRDLELYLSDSYTGIRVFTEAEFAIKAWRETFNYLLPYLILRCREGYMLNDLIGFFFHVYPNAIPDLYPKYRADILNTLGQAIMSPVFWDDNDLSQEVIQFEWNYYHRQGDNNFMAFFSPAIFFCLKYLRPDEIETWTDSLVQINGRYWHFALMNWLFKETFQVLLPFDLEDMTPSIAVKPTHNFGVGSVISDIQLPTANTQAFIKNLKEHNCYFSLSN